MVDTRKMIAVLRSIPEIFSYEYGNSSTKTKHLAGITDAYSYIFENKGNIDEKYHFSVNRIVRDNFNAKCIHNNSTFRDLKLDYLTLGEAIDPKKISGLMNRLFFQISKDEKKLDPLEKAALMMFGNFVVQPSGDGNKRTGFILGNKVLLDYNLTPVYFKKNKENLDAMFTFWKQMYAWKPFINGQEVYNKDYLKPALSGIKHFLTFSYCRELHSMLILFFS